MFDWFKKKEETNSIIEKVQDEIVEEKSIKEKLKNEFKEIFFNFSKEIYEFDDQYNRSLIELNSNKEKLKNVDKYCDSTGYKELINLHHDTMRERKKKFTDNDIDYIIEFYPSVYINYINNIMINSEKFLNIINGENSVYFEKEKYFISFYTDDIKALITDMKEIEDIFDNKNNIVETIKDLKIKIEFIRAKYLKFIDSNDKFKDEKYQFKLRIQHSECADKITDKRKEYWSTVDSEEFRKSIINYLTVNTNASRDNIDRLRNSPNTEIGTRSFINRYFITDTNEINIDFINIADLNILYNDFEEFNCITQYRQELKNIGDTIQENVKKYNDDVPNINNQIVVDSDITLFSNKMKSLCEELSYNNEYLQSLKNKILDFNKRLNNTILFEPPKIDYFIKKCLDDVEEK